MFHINGKDAKCISLSCHVNPRGWLNLKVFFVSIVVYHRIVDIVCCPFDRWTTRLRVHCERVDAYEN